MFQRVKHIMAMHRVLLVIIGLYGAALAVYVYGLDALGVIDLAGQTVFSPMLLAQCAVLVLLLAAVVALGIFLCVIVIYPDGRARMAPFMRGSVWLNAAVVLLGFSVLFYGFGIGKSLIGQVSPFVWDPALARLERGLHFGHYPHDILHAVLPAAWFMTVIDRLYFGWFYVCYCVFTLVSFQRADSFARQHFCVAFALIWIVLGTVLATGFASAGPIFYDVFHEGIASYTQAVQVMKAQDLLALPVYDFLLGLVRNDSVVDVNGPSAFPSMHVAAAAVIFFYVQRYGAWWQMLLALAFLVTVMVGAVYLLWHYAVDAYFSVAAAYGVWKAAEYCLHKFQPELT